MVKQQHQLFVGLLTAADALVVALMSGLAWVVRSRLAEGYLPAFPRDWESYVRGPLLLFLIPIALVCMRLFGLYQPRRDRSILSEIGQISKASITSIGAIIVVLWAVGNDAIGSGGPLGRDASGLVVGPRPSSAVLLGYEFDPGRVQLGLLALLLPTGLVLHRLVFRLVVRELRRRGWNQRHVAIVGLGRAARVMAQTIARNSWTGLRVQYFISHKQQNRRTECLDRPVLGGLQDLESTLQHCPVDAVYLALPNECASEVPQLLRRLERFAIDVRIVPDVNPRYLPLSMSAHVLDGTPVLSYRESPLAGLGGVAKRALDITGAFLGLLIFALPMLLIVLLIRISGPGPIVYKQRRISIGGRTFKIYKFRTMRHEPDKAKHEPNGPEWTREGDERITPVGRWLRATSLDELPQLLNVLKGQMSLVGPRPERPELIDRFREQWRGYMVRQHVKAGMTGWAQIHGLRGNTCLKKRLQYDLHYIRHWSLTLDLWILWLTIFRGFVHPAAR